uniref:MULE domain-containing protein n=1 Tax=Rhabditophanes sp. KR3021 TaxID=114890 RepID=A0AC35TWJ8_9BILA
GCKGSGTVYENIFEAKNNHDHCAVHTKISIHKIKDEVYASACSSVENPRILIAKAVTNVQDSILSMLPSTTTLSRTISKKRKANTGDPYISNNTSASDIKLRNSKKALIDGTFKIVPGQFYQMIVVHGYYKDTYLPLAYCLLEDKCQEYYENIVDVIFNGESALEIMTVDFELGLINSIKCTFPDIQINGCFFHFAQAVWRSIQSAGLSKVYNDDADIALLLRCFIGIAFVLVEKVNEYYQILSKKVKADIPDSDKFLKYFKTTWIGE